MIDQNFDVSCGATALFVGRVRNHHQGKAVQKLFYDCYLRMAEKMIGDIVDLAKEEWKVVGINILHRIGELKIGDIAIAIAVHSFHRAEAFLACREILERIKKTVPIWKKEFYGDGTQEWILTCQ